MTLKTNIHDLTIDIKAKGVQSRDRFNQKDTFAFLNTVSIYASEASKRFREEGADSLAEQAEDFADMLYDMMKATGYYD